ncbi:response regulator [Hymenobacter sp. H14-R3]|uniref:response regulator n=1 Tax=Hymenobacter sp. H14-R3 TaxID=3046308 RepID=UPI0024B890A1|nr:response regulator [Hymenobacter sp. H14-R3]MDJ0366137.1 response regulator [Hymenobacter sp. H14-R3]
MPTSSDGLLRARHEPIGKVAARQRIQALEQELAAAQAKTAAAHRLVEESLADTSDGVLLVNEARRVRLVNAALCTLFGLSQPPAHWVGQPAALVEAQVRACLADPAAFDRLLAHPTGQYVSFQLLAIQVIELKVLALPAVDGGYLLSCRDTTTRGDFFQRMQELACIPDQNPNPVMRFGLGGEQLYANPAAERLWAELATAPLQQAELLTLTQAALRSNEPLETELPLAHSRLMQACLVPFEAAGYVNVYLVDITTRYRAGRALQHAKETAEAAAAAKETFLANMSHEIRTPLNGVLGMAAQLAKTPLDSQQQQLLSIVRTSGHFLLSVLNDVLDMSKITSGKLELDHAPFEFCQVASEALALLAWQASEKGLDFQFMPVGPPAPYPWVLGDGHRLSQVLVNLVGNALKFTDSGYVHVRSQVLAQTADALTLQVEVADSGSGIAADKQELIFEFFIQESADIQRQYGGSGLGLSICRALVQQMGGTLAVASQPGAGSTFTLVLTLPKAVPELRPRLPLVAASRTGSLAGLRVLLVDDNEINRSVARYLLDDWGTALHEAGNGPDALALLAAQPFDVVLLDIQMPGMTGLEVLQQLRRHPNPQRAATPTIAFTANAFRADAERYLAAGFTDYLTKPFGEDSLHAKLVGHRPAPAPASFDFTYLQGQAQGNQALITKIISAFLRNTPPLLADLRAAADAGRWPEVAALVHHLRSNIQVLGIQHTEASLATLRTAPPATGPVAAAFARAAHQLADHLDAALLVLPSHLP